MIEKANLWLSISRAAAIWIFVIALAYTTWARHVDSVKNLHEICEFMWVRVCNQYFPKESRKDAL